MPTTAATQGNPFASAPTDKKDDAKNKSLGIDKNDPKSTAKAKSAFDKDRQRFEESMGLSWKLFMTQMLHQNPLEPMKPEQMLQSIGLVTQVEQLIKNNEEMRNVNATLKEMQSLQAYDIQNKTADVEGNSFEVRPLKLNYHIDPRDQVTAGFIKVFDAENKVISSIRLTPEELRGGGHEIDFDGLDSKKEYLLPNGEYTYKLWQRDILGNETTSDEKQLKIDRKSIKLTYNLAENAFIKDERSKPFIDITNSKGMSIKRIPIIPTKGKHEVEIPYYDKETKSLLEDGIYNFKVYAKDKDGKPIEVKTSTVGTIDAVTKEDGNSMVNIYGRKVPLSRVLGVIK